MTSAVIAGLLTLTANSHPGFAHNDYVHSRPLLEAYENGFRYVEADVFLVQGELLVAHDRKDVKSERTLDKLYLEPLSKLKFEGRFWLMVDIKADGALVYEALEKELAKYRRMLVRWTDAGPDSGRVAVVLSGDRPVTQVSAQKERWVAIDGRPEDLAKNPPVGLVPWISTSYLGFNHPLAAYVQKVHDQGRKVRFWAVPDTPAFWKMQLEEGVDLINTDRPQQFAEWWKAARP